MNIKIINCLLIITLLAIVTPLISFGQTALDDSFLELIMTPKNPEPFQMVTFNIKSFSYDLTRAKVRWSVDGVEKKTEIGLTEFSIPAGKGGQKTTIRVIAEISAGEIRGKEISFIPGSVDLIYEAVSYAPPFYKGKALNPNEGVGLVTAVPELIKGNGLKIPAKDIIYSWSYNSQAVQSASGYGKSSFSFTGTVPIRDMTVEVTASSLEGDVKASKLIKIPSIYPKIIFYENNPVYGLMLNKAIINSVNMNADEFSVLAIPYFFSTKDTASSDLDYAWQLNGKTVDNQTPKNSFTARVEKAGSGVANISLNIRNSTRILQSAGNNYSLNFQKI